MIRYGFLSCPSRFFRPRRRKTTLIAFSTNSRDGVFFRREDARCTRLSEGARFPSRVWMPVRLLSITLAGPVGPAVPLPLDLGIKGEYGATLAAGAIPSTGGTSIQQQDTVSTFSATCLDTAGVTGAIEFSVTTTYK